MSTPDQIGEQIGSDGMPVGSRAKLSIFFDPGLGPVLRDPNNLLWQLVITLAEDGSPVLGLQQVTI